MGAGAFEKTSILPKSVWVDSSETGPRSVDLGAAEGGGEGRWAVDVKLRRLVCEVRARWRHVLWEIPWLRCDESAFGMDDACRCPGREVRMVSVARRARRSGILGDAMMFQWQRIINWYVLVTFRDVAIDEKLGEIGDNVYFMICFSLGVLAGKFRFTDESMSLL